MDREIQEAIINSRNGWQPGYPASDLLLSAPQSSRWPKSSLAATEAIGAKGGGLVDLWEASPVRLEGDGPHAEELIDLLFPPDCLLCVAKKPADSRTLPREDWRGKLGTHSLMVPSPMTTRTGRRKDGRISARCLDNTGPRRFLVVEFDFKSGHSDGRPTPEAPMLVRLAAQGFGVHDLCASLLLHLAASAPLVLVTHSGGKSLHGWFAADGVPLDDLRQFFGYAVRIGADPATWTRCQLIRIPEGLRDTGKRQQLCFFNPAVIPLGMNLNIPNLN